MARQGLNATLSYIRGTAKHTYQVRVKSVTFGTMMVADESHARTHRAYYPHRTAPERFQIVVMLKGWGERRDFVNWMSYYGEYVLDPDLRQGDFPSMTVSVPSRDFSNQGVPLEGGYIWGERVGNMYFELPIVFETAIDVGQKTKPKTSYVDNKWLAFSKDKAIEFFYPIGTQLAGDQEPVGGYDKIVYPGDPGQYGRPAPEPSVPGLPNAVQKPPTIGMR